VPEDHDNRTQLGAGPARRGLPLDGLRIDERHEAESIRVTLEGELDIATGAQLSERLRELGLAGIPTVLDLSNLGFIDCSGLRVVLEALEEADLRHSPLELASSYSNRMRRLLELINSPRLADRLRRGAS
jgi:anti-anti-sigma factor